MKIQFHYLGCVPDFPKMNEIPKDFIDAICHGVILALQEKGKLADRQCFDAEKTLLAQRVSIKGQSDD